jgi:pimeloyl-ACP methyl ester carboxylesterase
MPFAITADGARLYFEVVGSGEPLLLISGQSNDHLCWKYVRSDFTARYQVIVYDHRGTGSSDKPEAPAYSTRGFAADAIAILDHLQIARAHAYGISMGGRVCQWLAIDYPQRLGALVMGCSTPGNTHGVRRPPQVDALMKSGDPQRMLDLLVSDAWARLNQEFLVELAVAAMHKPMPRYAKKLHYRASEAHNAWELLHTIRAPTLLLHGSADQVNLPANSGLLAQRIPGAQLEIIEGAHHGYFWEFHIQASRMVLDFLEQHPLAESRE